MSTKVKVELAHAEPKHLDNSIEYKKRVQDEDYIAYHSEDGEVWLNIGQVLKPEPSPEKCPTSGCCIPAGEC